MSSLPTPDWRITTQTGVSDEEYLRIAVRLARAFGWRRHVNGFWFRGEFPFPDELHTWDQVCATLFIAAICPPPDELAAQEM